MRLPGAGLRDWIPTALRGAEDRQSGFVVSGVGSLAILTIGRHLSAALRHSGSLQQHFALSDAGSSNIIVIFGFFNEYLRYLFT